MRCSCRAGGEERGKRNRFRIIQQKPLFMLLLQTAHPITAGDIGVMVQADKACAYSSGTFIDPSGTCRPRETWWGPRKIFLVLFMVPSDMI